MSRPTACPHCHKVMNLPAGVEGHHRLKCPKCHGKFTADGSGSWPPTATPASVSAAASRPASQGHGDPDLPTAAGDLRETFDLPLLTGDDAGSPVADAMALFQDHAPAPSRRRGGEGRSRARPCPTCRGIVPVGMSICPACNLDLETGKPAMLSVDEFLDEAPLLSRQVALPLGIAVVGGVSFVVSLILAVAALMAWSRGTSGADLLLCVCLFGLLAAVQFLRGKTAKLLIVALALGAVIDVIALVALPVLEAIDGKPAVGLAPDHLDDEEMVGVKPYWERLDTRRLTWGIAVLLAEAVTFGYLMTPGVRRHFRRP